METCPKCNSLCVVPIAYGKPSNDLAEAAAMGLVVLGGCLIGYSQANEKCLKCGFTWFQQPVPGVPRKEFQSFISQFHHFLSDIEMRVELSLDALSQQSIEYGRLLVKRQRRQDFGRSWMREAPFLPH